MQEDEEQEANAGNDDFFSDDELDGEISGDDNEMEDELSVTVLSPEVLFFLGDFCF